MKEKKRGSVPLTDKKKERFCCIYAAICWGNPVEAVRRAGLIVPEGMDAVTFAGELFEEEPVRERIRSLRKMRARVSVADETWIRENLTDIATHAAKDSDRIRALASLAKVVMGNKTRRKNSCRELPLAELEQMLLPSFEGCPDGYTEDGQSPPF